MKSFEKFHYLKLILLFILSATPAPCTGSCGTPSWKGDDYCDDENNNCGCDWDGGDCCGSNVDTEYCSACECLDPNFKR